jgi:hypothetical protein
LRKGDVRDSALTAHSFDSDYHFMIVEISGDDLYFQTISRKGATVDSGVFHRPGAPVTAASPAPAPEPVLVAIPPVMPAGRTTPEGQGPTPPSPAPPQ